MLRVNITVLALLLTCATIVSCDWAKPNQAESARIRTTLEAIPLNQKVQLTNDEWKYILTGRQNYVLRRRGTELPFVNAYGHTHEKGIYFCAACSNPLFNSDAKYDSGTGWPSFWQPIEGSEGVRGSEGSELTIDTPNASKSLSFRNQSRRNCGQSLTIYISRNQGRSYPS